MQNATVEVLANPFDTIINACDALCLPHEIEPLDLAIFLVAPEIAH